MNITWSASEFIANDKNPSWYLVLGVGTVVAAVLAYFITGHDVVVAVVMIIVGIIFGVTASHQPRVLDYSIENHGMRIGAKYYPYELFKSFSIIDGGGPSSIVMNPLKRFMVPLTVYYPPEQAESVTQALSTYLPHENRSLDAVESLMRKVRF
jgi:hypothetical protein